MTARRAAVVLAVALTAAAVVACVRPRRFVVDGLSMAPGLMPGDVVATGWLPLTDRLREPRRFERWVVTTPEGEAAVKRLAGLPGERVVIRDGDLVVNDAVVVKPPDVFLPMAVATRAPVEVDDHCGWLPPTEVLDDAEFATEVNRPLETAHDVGLAAYVQTERSASHAQAVVGGRRITWWLPAQATIWIVSGRLDRHLVAVAWRVRDEQAGVAGHGPLPSSAPAAWTVAEPWPAAASGAAEGIELAIEPPARLVHATPWRDIHLRPDSGAAAWQLDWQAFLLLGDHPTGSIDSRTWGPLHRAALRHRLAP